MQTFGLELVKERRQKPIATNDPENSNSLIDILISAYDDETRSQLSDEEVRISFLIFSLRDSWKDFSRALLLFDLIHFVLLTGLLLGFIISVSST